MNSNKHSIFARIYLVFALFVIPAIGLNEGLKYLVRESRKNAIKSAAPDLLNLASSLAFHADENEFWISRFSTLFTQTDSAEKLAEKMDELSGLCKVKADYIIYKGDGDHFTDNFIGDMDRPELWKQAGHDLLKVLGKLYSNETYDSTDRLRPLFGRNFFVFFSRFPDNVFCSNVLSPTDFSNDRFRFWFGRKPGLIAVIRLKTEDLKKPAGLRFFSMNSRNPHVEFAIFKNSGIEKSEFNRIEAKNAFRVLEQNPEKDFIDIDDYIYVRAKISEKDQALIRIPFKYWKFREGIITLAIFFFIFLLQMALVKKRIFAINMESLPLLYQIIILMGISIGIPLMFLSFLAVGYFNNKKNILVYEKNRRMIDFIGEIDQNINTEKARMTRHFFKVIKDCGPLLKGDLESQQCKLQARNFFHLAQQASLLRKDQLHDFRKAIVENYDLSKEAEKNQGMLVEILKQHIACINGVSSEKTSIEKALLIEIFFQNPMNMIVHDLLKIDGATEEKAWGSDKLMIFLLPLKLFQEKIFDSCFISTSSQDAMAMTYTARIINRIVRNPFQFEVFVVQADKTLTNTNESILKFPEIAAFRPKISSIPFSEPLIVDYKKQPHIFVGLNSKKMREYSYCVLFPMSEIDKELKNEAGDLVIFTILIVGLVFFMLLTLYLNLLRPINRLHQAANALVKRDSSFRMPEGGDDEFAEMAQIFNASMGDFEELQLAGTVQSRLLPSKPLEVEGFSIYGKSLPMAFMGGDYFDCFMAGENHFVMLLGDVAGHGVGAALIMAMAKAGVICADSAFDNPAEVLSRLHQIILAIKNKIQRKVMTFQYLVVDRSSKKMIYSNAGACSPVIVDSTTGTIRIIDHPGAVLGGFKKNVFHNLELEIKPGQAMIFYTDGMVESRNPSGDELGYPGLYDIFLKSYDSDARKFYEKIYSTYLEWLNGETPGDDLTIILAVCNDTTD